MGKGNFATSPVVASPAAPGVWPWGKATGPRRVGCSTHSFVSMDAMAHCANGIRADAVSLPPRVQPAARPPRGPPASPPASQHRRLPTAEAAASATSQSQSVASCSALSSLFTFPPAVSASESPVPRDGQRPTAAVAKGAEEEKLPLFSPPFRPPFFASLGRAGRAMLLEGVGCRRRRRRTALVAALGLRLGVSSGAIRVGRRGGDPSSAQPSGRAQRASRPRLAMDRTRGAGRAMQVKMRCDAAEAFLSGWDGILCSWCAEWCPGFPCLGCPLESGWKWLALRLPSCPGCWRASILWAASDRAETLQHVIIAPASGATVASDDPSGAVGEALPADSVANLALDPEGLAYPKSGLKNHQVRAGAAHS